MSAGRSGDQLTATFPFLSTLPETSRGDLLARSVRRRLEHKEVLVREESECGWLPFVVEGTLRIYKTSETGRELTLYRIEKGESCILSATCILNGNGFPAVAEAEGSTEVLLLPAKLLASLVEDNPAWRRYMFALYARRLDEVLLLVEEVAFHHVDVRIAAYLGRNASTRGAAIARTHAELADELGTSREVVTRILKDFEAAALIATSRGRIRVLDPEGLRKHAAPVADV